MLEGEQRRKREERQPMRRWRTPFAFAVLVIALVALIALVLVSL